MKKEKELSDMNHKLIPVFIIFLLVCMSIACGNSTTSNLSTAPVIPTATIDAQATIEAAIAATSAAQANLQATVDASIAATNSAALPTPTNTSEVAATIVIPPVPPVDEMTLSEEELQAMIDQAVEEAVAASTQASTSTTQYAADDDLTYDELEAMYVYLDAAEQALAYADDLIQAYYNIYGDLAYETVDYLLQVENDLEDIASSLETMSDAVGVAEAAIQQGAAIASETIEQLATTAQAVQSHLPETQALESGWSQHANFDRENRISQLAQIQPDSVPTDLTSTLREAFTFVDTVRAALEDNKLGRDELNIIAQLGANVSAGFNKHGGVKMQGLSGRTTEITGQLARGQFPQARNGLGSFESSLGQRPANLPKPSLPKRP
jgi:murein L,D-transpeptidase YcbB/YkuD